MISLTENKHARIYFLISALLIIYFGEVVYKNIFNHEQLSGFGYTEFMINFEGGFVRRGLVGELLFQFCSATGFSPLSTIYCICIAAWVSIVTFFLFKFKKNRWNWWLLMSPLFLGATFNVIRKDYLCYVILISIFYLLSKQYKHNNIINSFGVMFLICLGLLLHEAFIFWGIPIVLLLILKQKSTRIAGILISIITISLFLVLCKYRGNTDIADSIYNSWNSILQDGELTKTDNNSIGALGWDTTEAMKAHLKHNFTSAEFGKLTIIPRTLVAILVYYMFTNFLSVFMKQEDENAIRIKRRISILYVISFFCLLPMFTILSCDYGRLYQYILVTTFSALILLPGDRIDEALPVRITNQIVKFNRYLNRILVPTKGIMIMLLLIVNVTPFQFSISETIGYNIFSTLCNFPYFFTNLINALPIH